MAPRLSGWRLLFLVAHIASSAAAKPARPLSLADVLLLRRGVAGGAAGRARTIACGIAAGAMWGAGVVFAVIAGREIGVAVTVSIARCSPIVAAVWGLAYWGEGKHARARARAYIAMMFVLYLVGIFLIARSEPAR